MPPLTESKYVEQKRFFQIELLIRGKLNNKNIKNEILGFYCRMNSLSF